MSGSLLRRPVPDRAEPGLGLPRFAALRAVAALMLREMESTYGRKPGGYVWALLEPIGVIVVLSIGFSFLMRHPPIGNSFLLFFATGYLPFSLYTSMAQKNQTALRASRPLLSYPRVNWIDVIIARTLLNLLTQLLVFCIVFCGIVVVSDTNAVIDVVPILVGLSVVALLGMGVGLMNGMIGGIWPVWLSLWKIFSRPLFFVSGILFTYESMSDQIQAIIWWNPILHAVSILRTGFYPTYMADFVSLTYCYGVGLGLVTFGLLFMRRWHKVVFER